MKWTNRWTDVKLLLLPLPFLHPPTPCCFCLSSRFHGDGSQQHSDWKHLSCEWVGGKSCFASSFLTPFLTFFLHSLFLPRSTLVLVNKPLHHVILPIPFTLLTGNQLMSEMVGGLHNGILFFFLRWGEEEGGWRGRLWSFVAVFQGLLESSHPENWHSVSVNCFSSGSNPDKLWSGSAPQRKRQSKQIYSYKQLK